MLQIMQPQIHLVITMCNLWQTPLSQNQQVMQEQYNDKLSRHKHQKLGLQLVSQE